MPSLAAPLFTPGAHTLTRSLSYLCRLLTASGCALSVASGEEAAAAAVIEAREDEEEDAAGAVDEGRSKLDAGAGRFRGGLSPRCVGPEGRARARAHPGDEGLARSMCGFGGEGVCKRREGRERRGRWF